MFDDHFVTGGTVAVCVMIKRCRLAVDDDGFNIFSFDGRDGYFFGTGEGDGNFIIIGMSKNDRFFVCGFLADEISRIGKRDTAGFVGETYFS